LTLETALTEKLFLRIPISEGLESSRMLNFLN